MATSLYHTQLPSTMSDQARAEQQRLQTTLDSAGGTCSWEWDINRNILMGDARLAAITNQDAAALAEGVSTERFFAAIHPDDLKRIRLAVAGVMAGSEVFSKQYRLLKPDGGYRWVQANGRAIYDIEDRPVAFAGVLVDITEQRRVADQLRIAQSAGGVGTFQSDVGYGTVSVSEQFCRLFGLHPMATVSILALNDLIYPGDANLVDLTDPDVQQAESSIEFRVRRADDDAERWLARRGEYVDDPVSGERRFMGVVFDITDSKRMQEKLSQANEELSGVAREREQFIAVLGHDLRNPLASMSAGLRMLVNTGVGADNERVMRLMGESVQRMGNLINNLLDLARGRLGSGIGLQWSRAILIEPVLGQIVDEIRNVHSDRVIETDFDIPQPVNVDETRIGQLLSNLLGNAVSHGAPDAAIRIIARIIGDTLELSVSNGGQPIPATTMERLFQPFYRGEARRGKQGLGLGLYIASEIAKAHSGTLEATSDQLETIFTFRMPLNNGQM